MRLAPLFPFFFCIVSIFPANGYGLSSWGCFGAGAAEYFVPGLGYAITLQVDKALILGGGRWYTGRKYSDAADSDDYESDPDKIYRTTDRDDSESGKEEVSIYLNESTWEANYYGNLYSNLLLTTWGDLYQNGCQPNRETYSLMASPFRFSHFYDNWMFWLPMAIALANYRFISDETKIDYYLEKGLSERDLKNDSFSQYYMVGVGEEMFFRGTIQHYLFESMKGYWGMSAASSRHGSIFAASLLFAAAHSGKGFTANSAQAFLFGLYEGYVYHPSLEEFDLTTAIAVHAWWDLLVAYAILNNAEFHEDRENVYDGDSSKSKTGNGVARSTVFPLMRIAFRF